MGAYAAVGAMAVGTVLQMSASSQAATAAKNQGVAQQNAANYQAQSMDIQAGQERAASQRNMIETQRRLGIAQSNLQANAAAGGGGAADPTVLNIDSQMTGEGELNALNNLYSGEQKAENLETGGTLQQYEGASAAYAGTAKGNAMQTGAYGTLLANSGSLYAKYGPISSPSGGGGFQASDPSYPGYG